MGAYGLHMTSCPFYLFPMPDQLSLSDDPVTFLLDTLDHIAKTPCSVFRSADERRLAMYYDAALSLAATFAEDRQEGVWLHHCDKLMTCDSKPETASADQLRLATLAIYGWGRCRLANGLQNKGNGTWIDAAREALRRYQSGRRGLRPPLMAA